MLHALSRVTQARLSFTTSSSTETRVLPRRGNKASFSGWSQNGFISGLFRMRAPILRSNGSPALHELRYEHFRMAWQTSDRASGLQSSGIGDEAWALFKQSQMAHFPGGRFPKKPRHCQSLNMPADKPGAMKDAYGNMKTHLKQLISNRISRITCA